MLYSYIFFLCNFIYPLFAVLTSTSTSTVVKDVTSMGEHFASGSYRLSGSARFWSETNFHTGLVSFVQNLLSLLSLFRSIKPIRNIKSIRAIKPIRSMKSIKSINVF